MQMNPPWRHHKPFLYVTYLILGKKNLIYQISKNFGNVLILADKIFETKDSSSNCNSKNKNIKRRAFLLEMRAGERLTEWKRKKKQAVHLKRFQATKQQNRVNHILASSLLNKSKILCRLRHGGTHSINQLTTF